MMYFFDFKTLIALKLINNQEASKTSFFFYINQTTNSAKITKKAVPKEQLIQIPQNSNIVYIDLNNLQQQTFTALKQ